MPRLSLWAFVAALTLVIWTPTLGAAPLEPPALIFESAPELEPRVRQLIDMDPELFLPGLERTGLEHAGEPIRVVVAGDDSPLATRAPGWVAGYAYGRLGTVVLLAERVPVYPNGSFEEVLRHEVAHVLIDRAAGHRPVPRWFHEGLAMSVAGEWGLSDRSQLSLAAWGRDEPDLEQLDRAFRGSSRDVAAAYALSAAFLRYLDGRYGTHLPALLLERVAAGEDFDDAFFGLTGITLRDAQLEFWSRDVFWLRWLPILASSTTLWAAVALLFLWARKRRRDKDREIEALWAEEEARHDERLRLRAELALAEDELAALDDESRTIH